jgi:hypothetical protein
MNSKSADLIRSKVTEEVPGLTKGKLYTVVTCGFFKGPYITLINDRNEKVSIYDPDKYLYTKT